MPDLKDVESCLKDYLGVSSSQAIFSLSSPTYDGDEDEDDGDDNDNRRPPGIRGFEDSDSDEGDGDTGKRLSLWPLHHNDPQPRPHPMDRLGVFCREWGKPAAITKHHSFGVSWTAPLIPQNLFGRSIEEIVTTLETDPALSLDVIQTLDVHEDAQTISLAESNSPKSNELSIDDSCTSILAESPSETLVESPWNEELESSCHAIPDASLNSDLLPSESPICAGGTPSSPPIPYSSLASNPLPVSPPPVRYGSPLVPVIHSGLEAARLKSSKPNRVPSSGGEEFYRQLIFDVKESRVIGRGEVCTVTSNTIEKHVAPRRRARRNENKNFPCPMKGCSFSFTRAKDAERHLKNTTIHDKGTGNSDSSKCCGFCGVVLSRPDARKRHERNGACGKRRSVRQLPRPHLSTPT